MSFVKCPTCAGHEMIGADTAAALESILSRTIAIDKHASHVETELWNMLNALRNARERAKPIDPLLT